MQSSSESKQNTENNSSSSSSSIGSNTNNTTSVPILNEQDGHTGEQQYDTELGANLTRFALLRFPWYYVTKAYRLRQPGHELFPYIHTMDTLEHHTEERSARETRHLQKWNERQRRAYEAQREKLEKLNLAGHSDAPMAPVKKEERLRSERLVRKVLIDPGFPGWLKSLAKTDGFTFVEEMTVDYDRQEMKLVTTNDSLKSYVSIHEDCVYRAKPTSSVTLTSDDGQRSATVQVDWTEKEQTAYMKLHTYLFGMEKRIESFGSQIFVSRAMDALANEKKVIEGLIRSEESG